MQKTRGALPRALDAIHHRFRKSVFQCLIYYKIGGEYNGHRNFKGYGPLPVNHA